MGAAVTSPRGVQASFDELGRDLRHVTFCVVDLETTGGSPTAGAMITEVGAVKVQGGEVVAEFQTLVDPGTHIPASIAVLTGISDAMVADAPRIDAVLPAFLEFARGCVLVAHNAPFDLGFLRHFAERLDRPWPRFESVDTATLARRVLTRDEAPDCKLATLARHFSADTAPDHRALSDARATVDVLHALIGRLGSLGVNTLEELSTFTSRVTAAQRKKTHLADHLPYRPGVYLFRDAHDHVLYIGTSRNLRTRVRSYFTSSETRTRIGEMVGLAARIEGIECATALEARVRELRLLAAHKPPYNKRSRHPERTSWVKLSNEPWPRLSVVTKVADDGADYLGPFTRRHSAESAVAALNEVFTIRQCGGRLPRRPERVACALAEMGACLSPCDGTADPGSYAAEVARVREAITGDPAQVVDSLLTKMHNLSDQHRFEDAGSHRDRLANLVRGCARTQRLSTLTRCSELVAARRGAGGGWEVHVIRYGRLVAADTLPEVLPAGTDQHDWVRALRTGAETVVPGQGPTPCATAAETELVLAWLESEETRLVHVDGEWSCPTAGASRHLGLFDAAEREVR